MRVTLHRSGGGRAAVPESEWLSVDGTRFDAWRSTGAPAVGRFSGALTADQAEELDRAVVACTGSAPEPPTPTPGAVRVSLDVGGISTSYGSGSPPPGPWTELDRVLGELLDAVVGQPVAAVALRVDDDGVRLEHAGSEEIGVDLGDAGFVAVWWAGWYEEVDRAEGALGDGSATAAPGWSLPVEVGPGPGRHDATLHVTVRMALLAEGERAVVEVAHAPPLPRPDSAG